MAHLFIFVRDEMRTASKYGDNEHANRLRNVLIMPKQAVFSNRL